jgi:hypothetical protein
MNYEVRALAKDRSRNRNGRVGAGRRSGPERKRDADRSAGCRPSGSFPGARQLPESRPSLCPAIFAIPVCAGRVSGAGLWAPFSNFHFGVPQTGSIVDRDRFAECPSGATLAQLKATRSFLILCLLGLAGADAAAINERTFVFRRMHHRGQRRRHFVAGATSQSDPLLLLDPGIGQGLGEASDREGRRRGAIDDRRNDAGRQEGKGASRRMCRSPCASRSAISAKEPMRPSLMSSIHPRALAIAMSRASRHSGLIAGFAQGACTMPFTAAKLGAVQGSVIVVGGWQKAKLSRPWSSADASPVGTRQTSNA